LAWRAYGTNHDTTMPEVSNKSFFIKTSILFLHGQYTIDKE